MIKGQIHSQVINDVKSERYKSDSNTIQRTYLIKIGDRYHASVASEDLRRPECSKCEKKSNKTS